jgi:MOSC N-terminal beta barrel domain
MVRLELRPAGSQPYQVQVIRSASGGFQSCQNSGSTFFGVIEELWRYPVKSMLGEQINATEVTESGLLGDRAYALRDMSDGKIATAKNPRKWPNLFDYRATLVGVPIAGVKLPPALLRKSFRMMPSLTACTGVLSGLMISIAPCQ